MGEGGGLAAPCYVWSHLINYSIKMICSKCGYRRVECEQLGVFLEGSSAAGHRGSGFEVAGGKVVAQASRAVCELLAHWGGPPP